MDAGNKSLRNTLEDIITIRFTTQAETPGFRVHRHPEQILIHSATQAETARRISAHDGSGISIHSATQAETLSAVVGQWRYHDFNPLRHTGGDDPRFPLARPRWKFQSTPPHRRRHRVPVPDPDGQYFNPLRHTGGDECVTA